MQPLSFAGTSGCGSTPGPFGEIDRADARTDAVLEREGISVITLAPQMQAYAEQNKVFLHGFGANISNGHWNQLGHRLAGELIAQKLCEGFLK